MSPVLVDQRSLLIIVVGILLALVIAFYSGYFAGMRNTETSLPQSQARLELDLPEATASAAASSEAVLPAETVPGADIDVDSADRPVISTEPVTSVTVAAPAPAPAPAEAITPSIGAADADLAIASSEKKASVTINIVDDASREDALYTIQIGIYGSQNNAENQVAKLTALGLSAYFDAYQNKKEEARYRVRFGYFASRSSASRALEAWLQGHPGSSGYLVSLAQ